LTETVVRPGVTDLPDRLPDHLLEVHIGAGADLAQDQDQAGGGGRLTGDPRIRVILEDPVEDGVADLVTHLVRVTLGHGLRGEEELSCGHSGGKGSGGA
jgi:hypothetical protein